MTRVAILGNLARDRVDGGPPRVGGAPFHCGRALRALPMRSLIATKAAEADARLVRDLVRLGVPVRWHRSSSTSGFVIENDGASRRMVVDALGEPWTRDDVRGWLRPALAGVGWVHVGPLARSDFGAETLAELARDRVVSLDAQGLVRAARTGPLVLDADYDPDLLRHVSILKLAEEEARMLIDPADERSIAALGVPEVVVTLGPLGSIVYADGVAEHVPAWPIHESDPTGAGDAFSAAYLAARAGGQTPTSAARRATAVVGSLLR